MRGKPFPNDHLDLFFNATVDAAIVLATFMRAAEAVGLGCCPISVIRDHARAVSDLLELPDKVVPVAGMCVGWPADEGGITPRLVACDDAARRAFRRRRFGRADRRLRPSARRARVPTGTSAIRRASARAEFYGWSEDKARQYAVPLRADFGDFVRAQGFHLD